MIIVDLMMISLLRFILSKDKKKKNEQEMFLG